MRRAADPIAKDRAQAVALFGNKVSRETWERLDRFVALLLKWQKTTNLVAASTLPDLWTRHVADSLQLIALAPASRRWIDLGAGAGFPGLVIACALAETGQVHLVESNQKKAAFLRETTRLLSLPAIVHTQRIEDFVAGSEEHFDAVTARALAPLDRLLAFASPLLRNGAIGVFPKGQDVEAELTQAAKSWSIKFELVPSLTGAKAKIVIVRHASKIL